MFSVMKVNLEWFMYYVLIKSLALRICWCLTSMKNDGSMTSQLLKMDDSKAGETRIDELSSGREIKRQLIKAMKELRDLGLVARVIDEIDDENWLMMFVQELEVHVKQIIQMERKIKLGCSNSCTSAFCTWL